MAACSLVTTRDEMPPELDYAAEEYLQGEITSVWKDEIKVNPNECDLECVTISIPRINDYTSLRNSHLQVTCKVTKPKGVACAHSGTDADKVSVVNNVAHSLWKNVKITINGKIVEDTDALYPYRAYFEELLGRAAYSLEKRKALIGWTKDTAGKFDKSEKGGGNVGMDARSAAFENSAEVTLVYPIACDLMKESLLLPPQLEITIELQRSPNDFVLIADGTTKYEMHITAMKMYVERATVRPELTVAHKRLFSTLPDNVLTLPARRVHIDTHLINTLQAEASIPMFSNRVLPDRLFVVFVSKTAASGKYAENPFAFSHYSVNEIKVVANSVNFPRREYKPDFSKAHGYIREYHALLEELGAHTGNVAIDLSEEDFQQGYTIFPFRLVPRTCNGELLGLQQTGSASLEVKFATALTDVIQVLVLSETRASLSIPNVLPSTAV
jgi:hypothetical protein